MDLARCGQIGCLQDGLITRSQALKVLAENQIGLLLDQGTWERVHESVYRIKGSPQTWRQHVRAATLTNFKISAIASHLTAARLWGILEWEPPDIEVLVPFKQSCRLPYVTVHRTRYWHGGIATGRAGIRVTTPARTLIDMTAVTSERVVKHALDLAITSHIVTLDQIATELKLIGTQGRKRCSLLFNVLELRAEASERTGSPSEIEVLGWFEEAGLPVPIPQAPIRVSPSRVVHPDFFYPDHKIAIEMTSWRWHGGPTKFEEDIRRKNDLRKLGISILEFSAKTAKADVIAVVRQALE